MSHTADLSDHVIAELQAENRLLRQLLWVWHGCPLGVHYGDDGELQCPGLRPEGHPPIDFKRDTARRIEDALQAPSLRGIQLHQDDVCRHCGATRWSWDAGKPCPSGAHEWITPQESG